MVLRRSSLVDGRAGARVLGDADVAAALRVCSADPVGSVLAAARLEYAAAAGVRAAGGTLWGFEVDGALRAICWAGANMVPVVPTDDVALRDHVLDAFGFLAKDHGRHCSSIVGPADAVLGLWGRLRPTWPGAREVRDDQPSMVINDAPLLEPDPDVRRSSLDEFDRVLPACVRMFTEEVGYSPVSGPGGPYEMRVRGLIRDGRSFVRTDGDGRVQFKAELGAVAGGVAQVQGVWVDPELRGRRLSEHGMAAVVERTRADVAGVVSLYVNGYNARAIAAYRAVGFRQVGTYATVLF